VFETHIDDEGIATLRMASPATANALTPQGFAELAAHLETLMAPSSGARVLVTLLHL
jgi:enoyl-CoA hydratase/carnithine racemase